MAFSFLIAISVSFSDTLKGKVMIINSDIHKSISGVEGLGI